MEVTIKIQIYMFAASSKSELILFTFSKLGFVSLLIKRADLIISVYY